MINLKINDNHKKMDRKTFLHDLFQFHNEYINDEIKDNHKYLTYKNLMKHYLSLSRKGIDIRKIYQSEDPFKSFLDFEETMDINYIKSVFTYYIELGFLNML